LVAAAGVSAFIHSFIDSFDISLSVCAKMPINDQSLSDWMYGTDLEDEYQAGRTLQSCDPSQSDWLSNLKLDLRAASARRKTVHCIVANTDTWYSRHAGISRCFPFFFFLFLFFC
jgi:hypothetical protein